MNDLNILNTIRSSHGFSRSVVYLVVVALIGLVAERIIYYSLADNEIIAKENAIEKIKRIAPHKARLMGLPGTKTHHNKKEKSNNTKLSEAVISVQDTLDVLAFNLINKNETNNAQDKLVQLYSDLKKYDKKAIEEFSKTNEHIKKHGLADIIKQRHIDMVENYQNQMNALLENINIIQNSSNVDSKLEEVLAARKQLEDKKLKRSPQPFDPNDLPNKSLKPNENNKPRTTAEQFVRAGMVNNPLTQYAALGDFNYSNLPGASAPEYLNETTEVKITQAIKDQAASLNHDAVKIYHWVRNNVVWIPSWGAMQDADITLGSLRGNSADIASLLIALLRASQIPARYVHGTIDVPSDKFMNWAGGFSVIEGAARYAASGGIPLEGVVEGGKIVKVRLEHIWVEAAADFYPSRAEKNRDADSWVELDASYKQYEHLKGLDVATIAKLDGEALATSFLNSGTVNEAEGWVSGFDHAVLQAAQIQTQTALTDHINANLPNATVGDVIGGKKTIIKEAAGLPSSLPSQIKIKGARYAMLPSALQPTIQFSLGRDVLNQPINPATLTWAKVNNEKVTLSFKPETQADEDALASLLPEGEITDISQLNTTISAYLINVLPEIKLNGQVIATGNAMPLGEDVDLSYKLIHPTHGQQTFFSPVVAGSYVSIATIGGSVSVNTLNRLQTKITNTKAILQSQDPTQIQSLNREDLMGDMFYAGTLGYFAQYTVLTHVSGLQQGSFQGLLPSVGTYGYVPKVNYFFGFPRSISPGGVEMDLDTVSTFTGTKTNNQAQLVDFVQQTGTLSSALEHAVPEQMFTSSTNPGEAVSAVKALVLANQQGQRTYHITNENQLTALPNIHHDESTMSEIQSALSAGKEVITHTDSISVPGWTGAGYIILDAETGEGAYKINGGLNGGNIVLAVLSSMMMFLTLAPAVALGSGAVLAAWAVPILVSVSLFTYAVYQMTKLWSGSDWIGFFKSELTQTILAANLLLKSIAIAAEAAKRSLLYLASAFSFMLSKLRCDTDCK
ncbi:MAG: hypothetical protein OEW99_00470 [Gammaproteobacteria bacterium]|nr:hypothetical protein [Gammaproteobacteria bacterium]